MEKTSWDGAKYKVGDDALLKQNQLMRGEGAVIFGIPSCYIEGVLVGRVYEKDRDMLDKIKKYFPNCYICNLDGKVIVE